jgi:hypothetical protein
MHQKYILAIIVLTASLCMGIASFVLAMQHNAEMRRLNSVITDWERLINNGDMAKFVAQQLQTLQNADKK